MRDAIDVYHHAYAERRADWKTNEEQLAAAAAVIEADREQVRLDQLEEIEVLRANVGHWVEEARLSARNANYWRSKCEALQADKAKLREALKRIARYDVGLQALIEDGEDTPENRAKYYEGRVEYRRSIARAALQETER